jgi:hypothetical protein
MTVIIECINWLIIVTDNNDAWWKPEIKLLGVESVTSKTLSNVVRKLFHYGPI